MIASPVEPEAAAQLSVRYARQRTGTGCVMSRIPFRIPTEVIGFVK